MVWLWLSLMFLDPMPSSFRVWCLAIIRAGAVLAKKMLIEQYLLHRFGGRKKTQGLACQPDQMFKDYGVVHRFGHRFAPGKRAVAGDKDCRAGQRIAPGKGLHDHLAGAGLVIV